MNKREAFYGQLKKAVSFFNSFDRKKTVKVVSHIDTDGICAASILVSALMRERIKYSISFVQQPDSRFLESIAKEGSDSAIFLDMGSAQSELIASALRGKKKVLILDHHFTEKWTTKSSVPSSVSSSADAEGFFHLNPHLSGISGSSDISGAGVAYLFATELNPKNWVLAHLAVVGAIGDCQEKNGFTGLNDDILRVAEKSGMIRTVKGLRIFGSQSRPVYKLLELCFDPFIPGVTGSEESAVRFLSSINIKLRAGSTLKKLSDLTDEEVKRLTSAIQGLLPKEKRSGIIGNIYILQKEKDGPFRDAKEFSTILNACGRMGSPGVGLGACIGDQKMKEKAAKMLLRYRKEIINALQWFNSAPPDVIKKKKYIIINAKYNVIPTIAGTVASILSRSDSVPGGTLILAMARLSGKETKISLRIAGNHDYSDDYDLREIMARLCSKVGCQSGGHRNAAGAVIETSKEKNLIEAAEAIFSRISMEERVS